MANLIGSSANQVSVNGMLGTMAFQDSEAVNISGGAINGVTYMLTDYADDTAAATGGIQVGQMYRTGSVIKVRVA